MGEPFSGDEAPLDIVSDCLNFDNIQVVARGSPAFMACVGRCDLFGQKIGRALLKEHAR
jgi:hypothetical protein